MLDTSTWDQVELDVIEDLNLDPLNVRFDLSPNATQSSVINHLFETAKVIDLVKSIMRDGFLTIDEVLVVKRDERYIVIEGNRRLAALKAIQNPNLVPHFRANVEKYVSNVEDRDSLRRIPVTVAPSQELANRVVAILHTGSQRVRWSPARQAAFFQRELDAGRSIEELIQIYPTIDVRKFASLASILQIFRSADYEDKGLNAFVHSNRFHTSTLDRLYSNPEFLTTVGIKHNNDSAKMELSVPKEVFNPIAEKIAADIRDKNIDTRVLGKVGSKSYKDYLATLASLRSYAEQDDSSADADPETETPSFDEFHATGEFGPQAAAVPIAATATGDFAGPAEERSQSDNGHAPLPAPVTSRRLTTTGLVPLPGYPAVEKVLREMAEINYRQFPNATFDLMRTLLEKTTKAYAHSKQEKIPKGTGGYVYLSNSLVWLEQYAKDNGEIYLIQVCEKVRGKHNFDTSPVSANHMNAINHNFGVFATLQEVEDTWNMILPILRFLLKGPSQP